MRPVLKRIAGAWRVLLLYVVLLALGMLSGEALHQIVAPEIHPLNEPLIDKLVSFALLVFIVTAAIPFVPGAEIGFALLLMFGAKAALVVYVSMLGALVLSYVVARLTPVHKLRALFEGLRLHRAAALVNDIGNAPLEARRTYLTQNLTSPLLHRIVRHKYLALAFAINLPGNSLIGGGGGIAFAAGLSGLYRVGPFVVCVACAVAPVPLMFAIFG